MTEGNTLTVVVGCTCCGRIEYSLFTYVEEYGDEPYASCVTKEVQLIQSLRNILELQDSANFPERHSFFIQEQRKKIDLLSVLDILDRAKVIKCVTKD